MPGTRTRTISIITALLLFHLCTTPAAAQVAFNLPAQPLAQTLKQFAIQADLNIYFDPPSVSGLRAPALRATMTPERALAKLLTGTPLRAIRVDNSTVRIVRDQNPRQPAPKRGGPRKSDPSAHKFYSEAATLRAAPALQEVVVTAEKRSERLVDVPISISVLQQATLHKLGAVQFRDFANTVPGLTFTTAGAGYTQISLRGVTLGQDVSPTVGIYLDDVPIGSSTAFAQGGQTALDVGLFDISHVDVLRGPQGTLYGASTMGGLIKYVTVTPNTRSFAGDTRIGISGTSSGGTNFDTSGSVNIPAVPGRVAIRATGYESRDGGYVDNVDLRRHDINQSDVYGGRLDLLFIPMDSLSVRIGTLLQNISRNGQATTDYSLSGARQYGSLSQHRLLPEPFEQHFRLVDANVNYDLGVATLTSIAAYQTIGTDVNYDFSALYVPLFSSLGLQYSAAGITQSLNTHKFTEELRLASASHYRLEWLIGGFYDHETSGNTQAFELRDLAGLPAPNNLYTFSGPTSYEEAAAFGDLTYKLTQHFDITAGIRHSSDHQVFTQFGSGLLISSTPTRRSTESVQTYLANARYHLTNHANLYVRYATGYRPGGPNFVANDPITGKPLAPLTFKADKLKSYDGGIKADVFPGRLGVDFDIYSIDWSNVQVLTARDGLSVYANAQGGATVQGSELSLNARPVPTITLTGAFAYQHAYLNSPEPDLGGAEGERLPNVPRFTAAVSVDYEISTALRLNPTAGATVRYVSDRYASFDRSLADPQYHLPSYTETDLRVGFDYRSCQIQIYAHNVLNDVGQLSAITSRGTAQVAVLQPRTFGISVSTSF